MPKAVRRLINAKDAARDIRAGVSDSDLMDKYGLSEKGLQRLFRKLVEGGVLKDSELVGRTAPVTPEERNTPVSAAVESKRTTSMQRAGSPQEDLFAGAGAGLRDGEHQQHAARDSYQEDEEFRPEPRSMDTSEWIILASSSAAALLCFLFFWFRWTLATFKSLIHEMGHAVFGWLFAYPSLPAFDIIWGGGVTMHAERRLGLLLLIYAGAATLLYICRKNLAALIFLGVLTITHLILSFTRLHSVLIIAMGHGTELIIAGFFLYRALSGRSIVHPAERPLYGIIGFFVVFANIGMAFTLLRSRSARAEYLDAKGGALDMDFIRIARDYLHVDMNIVIFVFLVCSVVTPVLAFLAFRYEQYLQAAFVMLLERNPEGARRVTALSLAKKGTRG